MSQLSPLTTQGALRSHSTRSTRDRSSRRKLALYRTLVTENRREDRSVREPHARLETGAQHRLRTREFGQAAQSGGPGEAPDDGNLDDESPTAS